MNTIHVIKASGDKEIFDEEKLRLSIIRAGIPQNIHNKVVAHIKDKLYPDISTKEVYRHISEFLDSNRFPKFWGKYSLKQAIMDFGPTGFPFEKFVARILQAQGFTVETDVIIAGKCISHEVDIMAQKNNQNIMVECKFHNSPGIRTDVKVALYVRARYLDIKFNLLKLDNSGMNIQNRVWLVTNTKCTADAISYANCMGIKIISWRYPNIGNLADLVEKYKLHPLTCLTNLSNFQKQQLLNLNLVTCKDLHENNSWPNFLKLPNDKYNDLLSEVNFYL